MLNQAAVRGIALQFESFHALSLQIEAGGDEQDMELPPGVVGFADGEWVVAQILVGEESTSLAACVVDRGDGLRLAFEDRDWQQLWQFADRGAPPSIPPPSIRAQPNDLAQSAGERILVVDDDASTRHVLTQMLEAQGYLVSTVGSAEEAFDRLRELAVHLVVLDWKLPGMNGVEFCRRIRRDARCAALPVLFLTAQSSSSDLVQAFDAGADDFVGKPFRAAELHARIVGLLRRARLPAHDAHAR
jgi:two-component system, OmpR family, phosphate regulon response regulator PhoB